MPKRLYLSAGDDVWTAEVSTEGVRLEAGGPLISGEAIAASGRAAMDGDTVWVTIQGEVFAFDIRRSPERDRRGGHHAALMAPMPATVVRIAVKAGDAVRAGDVLIALEAMKMELPIRAPRDGVVLTVTCREGDLVQPEQELVELE